MAQRPPRPEKLQNPRGSRRRKGSPRNQGASGHIGPSQHRHSAHRRAGARSGGGLSSTRRQTTLPLLLRRFRVGELQGAGESEITRGRHYRLHRGQTSRMRARPHLPGTAQADRVGA